MTLKSLHFKLPLAFCKTNIKFVISDPENPGLHFKKLRFQQKNFEMTRVKKCLRFTYKPPRWTQHPRKPPQLRKKYAGMSGSIFLNFVHLLRGQETGTFRWFLSSNRSISACKAPTKLVIHSKDAPFFALHTHVIWTYYSLGFGLQMHLKLPQKWLITKKSLKSIYSLN